MSDETRAYTVDADDGRSERPQSEFRVEDRRHWAHPDSESEAEPETAAEPAAAGVVDELRARAEAAERKLQEYIEAFKASQEEQERFRDRMARDVERRVELRFGELVGELVEMVDDLDRALDHATNVPEAESLAVGVSMARKRFVDALGRHGVTPIDPRGLPFDPNEAEALRVDSVGDPGRNGVVTETLRAGYRLGELVLRPARVAVGRFVPDPADSAS